MSPDMKGIIKGLGGLASSRNLSSAVNPETYLQEVLMRWNKCLFSELVAHIKVAKI